MLRWTCRLAAGSGIKVAGFGRPAVGGGGPDHRNGFFRPKVAVRCQENQRGVTLPIGLDIFVRRFNKRRPCSTWWLKHNSIDAQRHAVGGGHTPGISERGPMVRA